MLKRSSFVRVTLVMILAILLPNAAMPFDACDSFGQDWIMNAGPFGGTFPGTILLTGCRDCDVSLACGGPMPVDGSATLTGPGSGGGAFSTLWSFTAFDFPTTTVCTSSHWTGTLAQGESVVMGQVSNEFGPQGAFTLTLGQACPANARRSGDPATSRIGRWPATTQNSSSNPFGPQ